MTTFRSLPAHAGLIRRGDPGYDEARAAWNLHADLRPEAVLTARAAADVVGGVLYARQHGLRIAPQTTGHLAGALGPLDGALLLRVAIGGVQVDPQRKVARVGAGAVWQDVVDAVTPHGLAALSGSSHDVGVLGYTLGGGASWLARKFGLSCNNVEAIEVVTPDGELLRTSAEAHPELFWALRGGGGNFGVVTHVELRLQAITEVFAGMTVWPASQAREVLTAWAGWAPRAPDEVTTSWRLLRLPPDPMLPEPLRDTPVVVIDGAVLGEQPDALLAPWRTIGTPLMDTWTAMSPAGLLQIHMDPPFPVPASGDTTLLSHLDARGIDTLLGTVDPGSVAPLLFVELRQLGGQLGRYAHGAGALDQLHGQFALFGVGMPTPEQEAALEARLDELLTAMAPWSSGRRYLNFAERGGAGDDGFGEWALGKLRAARRAWDPEQRMQSSHPIVGD